MQRKTSTTPSKIYTYGALPPVHHHELFDDEIRRAHRYRAALVEIERARRLLVTTAQSRHGSLGPVLTVIEHLRKEVAELRAQMKRLRAGGASERRDRSAERLRVAADVRSRMIDISVMRALCSWCRRWLRNDAWLRWCYTMIDEESYAVIRALRGGRRIDRFGHPVVPPFWGTYLLVEKAAESWRKSSDPPRFFRFDGSGRVGVQLQGGLRVAELLGGEDTRLRIAAATPLPRRGGIAQTRFLATHRTVKIRAGSIGREPIWVNLPFVMHRELPADGVIKWAWVRRRRIGVRYQYFLQFTVEAESFMPAVRRPVVGARRIVALDIGSRSVDDTVRVAFWASNHHRAGEAPGPSGLVDAGGSRGELRAPLTRLSGATWHGAGRRRPVPDDLSKSCEIQAGRSKDFDRIRDDLTAYKVTAGAAASSARPNPSLAWLRERTEHIVHWRSPARLGTLYRNWIRHDGDEEIYQAIGAFLRHDRHLLTWQSNERERYLRRRAERYRVWAADLARNNDLIVLPVRDYRRAEHAPEDAEHRLGHFTRKEMREVSPGFLVQTVRAAAQKYGTRILDVEIAGDDAHVLDYRVCERLLEFANGEAVERHAVALDARKPKNHVQSTESRARRRIGTPERIDPLAGQDVT